MLIHTKFLLSRHFKQSEKSLASILRDTSLHYVPFSMTACAVYVILNEVKNLSILPKMTGQYNRTN